MKCSKCGAELESNALVCPSCGQVISEEDRILAQNDGKELTKKEFLKLPAMKTCKSNINTCGILLYILGVINMGLQIFMGNLPVDGILLILLGLGVHLGISRVCATLCAVYGGFNVIYVLATTGRVGGWWILVIAIDAVIYTFRYHKAWNQYKKDGTLPVEQK